MAITVILISEDYSPMSEIIGPGPEGGRVGIQPHILLRLTNEPREPVTGKAQRQQWSSSAQSPDFLDPRQDSLSESSVNRPAEPSGISDIGCSSWVTFEKERCYLASGWFYKGQMVSKFPSDKPTPPRGELLPFLQKLPFLSGKPPGLHGVVCEPLFPFLSQVIPFSTTLKRPRPPSKTVSMTFKLPKAMPKLLLATWTWSCFNNHTRRLMDKTSQDLEKE